MIWKSGIRRGPDASRARSVAEIMMEVKSAQSTSDEYSPERLPPEVAFMLLLIGVAAIPLPGPGVPFIVAGGLVLWPKTFTPINNQMKTKYPAADASVFRVLKRFETDLNRRYPQREG